MKQMTVPKIPRAATELAAVFSRAGFGLWLVGGWVRDALLGTVHADLDFATNARPDDTKKVLEAWAGGTSGVWLTGFEFGTVGARKNNQTVEVTTFRSEVYSRESRNPEVSFAEDLETDLSRRDFTINAMAIALPGKEIIDPFSGLTDLASKRIRTPLSPEISFSDDPLRMLRALRFAATLNFEVNETILEAISNMSDRLGIVSAERIRDEFSKLMLGKSPSRSLALATATGLADQFIPELPALRLEQDPIHRHKDVFAHTLAVLDKITSVDGDDPDLPLRMSALLHDIGKPRTRRYGPEGVNFHYHEVVGAEMADKRLQALHYPSRFRQEVKELIYLHLRFHTYSLGWSDKAVRRYARDAGGLLDRLNKLVRADCTTRDVTKARGLSKRIDELEERITELAAKEELTRLRPALDGNEIMQHLGIPPGPAVGKARDFLMEVRIDEGEISKEEAYQRLDEWWATRDSER